VFRKNPREVRGYLDPLARPDYTEADIQAVSAVEDGRATPEQQKRCIRWLIQAMGTYDVSYRNVGPDPERDTIFAEGKRYAGNIIVWAIKVAETGTDPDKIAVRKLGETYGQQHPDEQAG